MNKISVKKIKFYILNWICSQKRDLVEFMSSNFQNIKKWYVSTYNIDASKHIDLTESMFITMMTNFGFGHEIDILKCLFWVLDLDDSGSIDFIELVMGIHMLS